MSRRTAEAHKAIEAAWQNEQQLVREGKGTRDWTPEQQQDILNIGKAYDGDGKAFEGHHMKSVEKYPDYQGNQKTYSFLQDQNIVKRTMENFKILQTAILIQPLEKRRILVKKAQNPVKV